MEVKKVKPVDARVGKSLGIMTVNGTITGALPARAFSARSSRGKVVQDYYQVLITTDKGNFAKIYFPVSSHSTRKGYQGRKIDIRVLDARNGRWIRYDVKFPRKLVGKKVEITGTVRKEGPRNYYINRITSMRIF